MKNHHNYRNIYQNKLKLSSMKVKMMKFQIYVMKKNRNMNRLKDKIYNKLVNRMMMSIIQLSSNHANEIIRQLLYSKRNTLYINYI